MRWARANRRRLNEYNRLRRAREAAWPKEKRDAAALRKTARYWGVSESDFEAFKKAHGGKCEICGITPQGRIHVDHNHTTGMIRGILCHACNYGIGCFKDNAARLVRAAQYLREREERPPLPNQRPRPHLKRRTKYKQWKTVPNKNYKEGDDRAISRREE
ncbi:MAG: endonuclease VII domain-containing protein [Bryobacterales bacterium]|nr:endonuclease VII domain-containing protein [Bryobacterales bacterium]